MPKTISATEAKVRLGAIIEQVVEQSEEVIIANRGQPKVVLINFAEYQKMQELRETDRRRQALAQLEALAEQVGARNQDLAQAEADQLADRFSREVVAEMVDEGKINYQGT